MPESSPIYSIIIPSSGRFAAIHQLIEHLRRMLARQQAVEVIVVQNGRFHQEVQEHVEEVAKSGAPIGFRYLHEPTAALLAGRHCGAMAAKGEVLVFIDDDIRVTPTWMDAIADSFQDPEVQLVGGPCVPDYRSAPPDWLKYFWHISPDGLRACGYLSLIEEHALRMEIDPGYVWGLNFAIRRSTLWEVGGFHPDGVPWKLRRFRGDGETAVSRQIAAKGGKAIFDPAAKIVHIVPPRRLTLEYMLRRAFLQGISNSYSAIRQMELGEPGATFTAPTWRRYLSQCVPAPIKQWLRPKPPELRAVNQACRDGFAYHQAEVAADHHLREWVLRPNYWDYRYPFRVDTSDSSSLHRTP